MSWRRKILSFFALAGGLIAAALGFILGKRKVSRPSVNQGEVEVARRRKQDEIQSTEAHVLVSRSVDPAAHDAAVGSLRQEFRQRAYGRVQAFFEGGGDRPGGEPDG